eukprot:gnl/TRDRNA2_/TRDRNA2_91217_c0_seq2.p1 gnl/TRDRNA2_/TRDRNA2_91217_c0~~gnl/TRDRNA2_/TRDRNA2_91217_c0_seq2.p1  ORF type:complete len:415 (-),score=50.74 gnl/TRDRNA2_/TRDRNA2_91217_c0_seq2:350-1594(-)
MGARRWGATSLDPNVDASVPTVYTCGCGHLGAELLCQLLRARGVRCVLDVRELDHSVKRPWFNADALSVTMREHGIAYEYIGDQSEDPGAVAAYAACADAPLCLLGMRALARECPRLHLAQWLQEQLSWHLVHLQPSPDAPPALRLLGHEHTGMVRRHTAASGHIAEVLSDLECAMELSGRWLDRISALHRVVRWEDWDAAGGRFPSGGERPLAIRLPWDTLLLMVPDFMTKSEVYALQQASLPGAVDYEQPRRQVRNPDGGFTQFNEHHKEAWLCDDYDYRDSRRVAAPRVHGGQPLKPWARELLQRAAAVALAPFNGAMCRWEPPGVHLKDGPHTYATHSGWPDETVIGLLAVGSTREYRIHGIPWFHGRGRQEASASVHISGGCAEFPAFRGLVRGAGRPAQGTLAIRSAT